jgi:hypothetical protein
MTTYAEWCIGFLANHGKDDVSPGELARAAFEAGKESGDRNAREECIRIVEEKTRWVDGLPAIMAIRETIK